MGRPAAGDPKARWGGDQGWPYLYGASPSPPAGGVGPRTCHTGTEGKSASPCRRCPLPLMVAIIFTRITLWPCRIAPKVVGGLCLRAWWQREPCNLQLAPVLGSPPWLSSPRGYESAASSNVSDTLLAATSEAPAPQPRGLVGAYGNVGASVKLSLHIYNTREPRLS
jgi:hypothetical protein